MEVGEQLRNVCELCEHRGTGSHYKKPTVSWWPHKGFEKMVLHLADMALAAQIVSHGLVLPSCAALIRPLPIKRPSTRQNLTRVREMDSAICVACYNQRGAIYSAQSAR